MNIVRLAATTLFVLLLALSINGDNYNVAPGNNSLLVALGCFWCAEQAFEQYAPGVVEAISGYAGANGNENPTYRNHPGNFEVILIEYDPAKTTYKLLVEYAWRNLDPFDSRGQFCDKGGSYLPAIFYATEEERISAEAVRDEILELYPEWGVASIVVPILERPVFWMAENYHQDYYITNSRNYGFYKERCGRTNRLKTVWGDDEYYCYHDLEASCFNMTVVNEAGVQVVTEVNVKNVPEETVSLLPQWAIIVISAASIVVGCILFICVGRWYKKKSK